MSESINNFGGLPPEYSSLDNSRVVVLPVPYDLTSTWMKGADKGPQAIIKASQAVELYDIETDSQVHLHGIYTDKPAVKGDAAPEKMVETVRGKVAAHLANNKFVVLVGGEHSVSIGAIQAHASRFPSMSVLQLDAHSDLRDEYEGSKYNHACVMARTRELCPITQVGIRSMDISEKPSMAPGQVFFAEKIQGRTGWIDEVVARLTDQVYITIDLDVFDPSIMPSTGTPEPGGLLWYEVLTLMRAVCRQKTVVGLDVVEMCPVKNTWAPEFLAAKLIFKILTYKLGARAG
jgi:agmatinase